MARLVVRGILPWRLLLGVGLFIGAMAGCSTGAGPANISLSVRFGDLGALTPNRTDYFVRVRHVGRGELQLQIEDLPVQVAGKPRIPQSYCGGVTRWGLNRTAAVTSPHVHAGIISARTIPVGKGEVRPSRGWRVFPRGQLRDEVPLAIRSVQQNVHRAADQVWFYVADPGRTSNDGRQGPCKHLVLLETKSAGKWRTVTRVQPAADDFVSAVTVSGCRIAGRQVVPTVAMAHAYARQIRRTHPACRVSVHLP